MRSVLITGVAGLFGVNMSNWILENRPEYKVVGIDNLFGGYIENIDHRVKFYHRDLAKDSIDDVFEDNEIEYVYHFASYAAEGLSPFMRKFNYETNIVATAVVVNQCIKHNVRRLVYTSSMSVYGKGKNDGSRFDENDIPCPIDPYGIAKYAGEMDIRVAGDHHGLDWCIIRPHNVIGKYQNIWDLYRNVIGIWMYRALHNEPMLIYGDGSHTRCFSDINDMLSPMWNAAVLPESSKQIVNLGGKVQYTINGAAKCFEEVTGYGNFDSREDRYEVEHANPTWEKSVDVLKFEQTTSLEDTIREMWKWAKNQPERERHKWEKYELEKGIYSYWR